MRLLPILSVVWLLGTCRSAAPELIERDGRWLALEFRSESALNDVNQHILASFSLLQTGDAD